MQEMLQHITPKKKKNGRSTSKEPQHLFQAKYTPGVQHGCQVLRGVLSVVHSSFQQLLQLLDLCHEDEWDVICLRLEELVQLAQRPVHICKSGVQGVGREVRLSFNSEIL